MSIYYYFIKSILNIHTKQISYQKDFIKIQIRNDIKEQ